MWRVGRYNMSDFEFDTKIICPWDPTATHKRIEQYKEYYKIKHDIVKECNPKVIIEIGVRAGYSAWAFLQACPKAKYYGFDADNKTHGGQGPKSYIPWAKEILKNYDATITSPFDTQIADVLPVGGDFYHIDGDHTTDGVMHDLSICCLGLQDNGHMLVDDYDYIKDVKTGVDRWLTSPVSPRNKKGAFDPSSVRIKHEYRKSLRGEILITKIVI